MSPAMPAQPATPVTSYAFRMRPYLVVSFILIAAATFIAYLPAFRGDLIWDDDTHITRPELRSLHGLYRIWFDVGATQQYYPLLHSAFWIEHKFWGDSPVGYHCANVVWHIGAAFLVMLTIRGLLREKGVDWADHAATLTAAVFALHPVHVESVAWITEQKNTMSAVFYLAAMLTYLRFDRARRPGTYLLATTLFIFGLLTKTVTASLPAALLLIFWWQRGKLSWKRDVVPLLPWFLMGAIGGLFTAWVEHNLIGAKGQAFDLSVVQRLLLAGRVVWFYLYKLVWPSELIFIYPRWSVNPGALSDWAYPLALIVVIVALLVVSRRARTPLAAFLFFVGSLFPVLGLFNVYPFLYSYVADHFQYLPSLGIIAFVSATIARLASKVPRRAVGTALLLPLPFALAVLTFRQCQLYADVQTLYESTILRNPECWMAHNNLGIFLRAKNRPDEAILHYRRALQIRPAYPEALNNLGCALNSMGRHDEAVVAYRQALQLRAANPEALGNLATALTELGQIGEALECLQRALRFDPGNAGLHANLGNAFLSAGRSEQAIDQFRRALVLDPDQPDIRVQLDLATAGTQLPEVAIASYERIVRSSPENAPAHFALAVALSQSGRIDPAIEHYQQALRIYPDYFEARNNLASLLARSGKVAQAIPHFEAVIALRPNHVELRMNLAVAYWSDGKSTKALEAAREAHNLAISAGQPDLAAKIDAWLESHRSHPIPAQAGP
jgi:tetratricopeptide (TPR) repeat protein